MVSLFPSHWRNSKKKSPCGPSRPAGTCKGTGAASILPCKKQEPSEWCVSGLPLQPEFSPGREAPPKGKNFRVPEKPVASPVNGLPRQKYQPEVWRFPPGMRSTVEGAMWGRAKKTLGGGQFRKGMKRIDQFFITMSTFYCYKKR